MYQELKVYDANRVSRYCWREQVFTCRGMACEEAWTQCRGKDVHETRILHKGKAPQDDERLYRWVGENDSGLCATAWYLTIEEAEEGRDRLKLRGGDIQEGILSTETIEPQPEKLNVRFELDEKGRPYTRINAHPERDGRNSRGKIFFPDRSFVGADAGEAVVSVAKEFDSYGFLSGEMVKFGMPDMEQFLDWAWENRSDILDVLFINHPGRGEYLAVERLGHKMRVVDTLDYDGNHFIYASGEPEAEADADRFLVSQKPLDEMFLEAAWGMDVSLEAVDALFARSRLFESGLAAADWEESIKFRGQLVDSAVQSGILSQFVSPSLHIEVMAFNSQNISLLGNYAYSDVEEIAKVVSKVNQEADEAGRAEVRKGLLLPF